MLEDFDCIRQSQLIEIEFPSKVPLEWQSQASHIVKNLLKITKNTA